MTFCAVKSCKNYVQKKNKGKEITFHQFPKDPVLVDRWIKIVRQSRNEICWKPNPRTCICSVHFCKNDKYFTKSGRQKIKKGAVPTKALFLSSKKSDNDETDKSDSDNDVHNAIKITEKSEFGPSTSSCVELDVSEVNNPEDPELQSSDLDSIYDSPKKAKLKKELRRKSVLLIKRGRKINNLQKRLRRLQKENAALKDIVKNLKKQSYIDNQTSAP